MASLFDQRVAEVCSRVVDEALAPGGWLREQIRRHVRWTQWGFANGTAIRHREAFTKSVAARIHEMGRAGRVRFLGIPLWTYRYPEEWCAKKADEVVTNWLADEKMKFGTRGFDWIDGRDIADDEMSNWEKV